MLSWMTLIEARDRHPDLAELRRLLDLLVVLATGFGLLSLLMGLGASDRGAVLVGIVLMAVAAAFAVMRSRIERVDLDVTVGIIVATLFTAGISVSLAQPIYSVFDIVP